MSLYKDEDEVNKILEHENNGCKKVEVKIIGPGNHGNGGSKKGEEHVFRDTEVKAELASLATLVGTRTASFLTGVNPSTISKFANGKTGNNDPDSELKAKVENKIVKIAEKAVDKADKLMEIFSDEKITELKTGEILPSAERLINIFNIINRRNEKNNTENKPQVILYAPKQVNIEEFTVKEV